MARKKQFNRRNLYRPGGKSSDLSTFVTTDERSTYIRTVLYPEAEFRGRPMILCSEPHRAGVKRRTFTKSGTAVEVENIEAEAVAIEADPHEEESECAEPDVETVAVD